MPLGPRQRLPGIACAGNVNKATGSACWGGCQALLLGLAFSSLGAGGGGRGITSRFPEKQPLLE